jgi:hypothetical protein
VTQHEVILRLLDLLVASRPLVAEHAELFAQVRRMVAQHRDPTAQEWTSLFAAYESASDRLESAVAAAIARHDAPADTFFEDAALRELRESEAEAEAAAFDPPEGDVEPFDGE